jgi:hypothetical protein
MPRESPIADYGRTFTLPQEDVDRIRADAEASAAMLDSMLEAAAQEKARTILQAFGKA